MSARAVIGRGMAVTKQLLDGPARADVQCALDAVSEQFPAFMYGLSRELVLPEEERYARCVALLFQYASVQLADDIADDECGYLAPARQLAPGTQWLLQHLFTTTLLGSTVRRETLTQATLAFLRVGVGQQREVRTRRWTLEESKQAAQALNGAQYAAYFSLLCCGTQHAAQAARLGHVFGVALHVVGDARGGDARFSALCPTEQRELASFAHDHAAAGLPSGFEFLDRQLQQLAARLKLLA